MEHKSDIPLWIGFGLASALLALAPAQWLLTSWRDPSYQSFGALYCAVIGALLAVSAMSKAQGPAPARRVFALFFAAAALRLGGQMLAINILSALALAIDVYAVARLLRVDHRRFALSPLWLALFFLFALPLGPILQRVAGFPMQMVSADLSCAMLSPFFPDLTCDGVRLKINGLDVLVDLPCSGASGLLLMVSLWTFLNVIYRPRFHVALLGGLAVGAAALIGNGARIAMLAAGLAMGVDTMEPHLHETIGLLALALSVLPVALFYRPRPAPARRAAWHLPALPRALQWPALIAALLGALSIPHAPRTPVDRSHPVAEVALPAQLLGHRAVPTPLSATEAAYFTTYGGTAQKAQFGPLGLNVVRTGSPLRHLHSPATCLLGMGYEVRFLGTRYAPMPTSVYEATGPDGAVWHVAVSFVSQNGHRTASVGEAVYSWLNGGARNWQSVQRITPARMPPETRAAFEAAALAALDL